MVAPSEIKRAKSSSLVAIKIVIKPKRDNKKTSTNTSSSQTSSTVIQPIKKAEEIKVLNQDLDSINIDQELNTSDLDTDINAVL